MNNLALSHAALGRHAEALKLFETAEALQEAKLGASHPRTLLMMYNLACVHASMIPGSTDGAKHADLAVGWLRKAVAAGYKDVAGMKKDNGPRCPARSRRTSGSSCPTWGRTGK